MCPDTWAVSQTMKYETFLIPGETPIPGGEGGKGEAFHPRIGCGPYHITSLTIYNFVGWWIQILGRRVEQCNMKLS